MKIRFRVKSITPIMAKKMIPLGEKYDGGCCSPCSPGEKSSEERVHYPSIYYRGPEDIGKMPDGEFTAVIKCRRKNQGEGEDEKGNKTYNFELEVRGIQIGGKASEKDSPLPRAMRSAAETIAEEGDRIRNEVDEDTED